MCHEKKTTLNTLRDPPNVLFATDDFSRYSPIFFISSLLEIQINAIARFCYSLIRKSFYYRVRHFVFLIPLCVLDASAYTEINKLTKACSTL